MKNKGFTLIELLAVIVILAIIALIATPIILGIINDARKGSAEESAKLIIGNVELAYSTAYTTNGGTIPTISDVAAKFKMDNATMDSTGNITTTLGVECSTTTGDGLVVVCTVNGTPFKTETLEISK